MAIGPNWEAFYPLQEAGFYLFCEVVLDNIEHVGFLFRIGVSGIEDPLSFQSLRPQPFNQVSPLWYMASLLQQFVVSACLTSCPRVLQGKEVVLQLGLPSLFSQGVLI